MTSSPYSAASAKLMAEIIREAEDRLSAQLTAAVAADQRAMTFAGLMLAAAGALIGTSLGTSPSGALAIPAFVTAVGLLMSAVLAVTSARPVAWDFVGNAPHCWKGDIINGASFHEGMALMAEFYDEMITDNDTAISAAAFWIRLSMGSALVSMGVGLVAAAVRLF